MTRRMRQFAHVARWLGEALLVWLVYQEAGPWTAVVLAALTIRAELDEYALTKLSENCFGGLVDSLDVMKKLEATQRRLDLEQRVTRELVMRVAVKYGVADQEPTT